MTVSFSTLAAEREAIKIQATTETMGSVPSNEALSLQRAAMGVIDRFSGFLGNLGKKFNQPDETAELISSKVSPKDAQLLRQLEAALDKGNYIDLVGIRVQVIPGLSVKWTELNASWDPAVRFAVDFYDDYLFPFQKFLALGVSDPSKFTTVGSVNKINQVDIDGYLGALAEGIKGNQKVNIRAYGECAERNADTITAFKKSLSYADSLVKGNPELVRGSIDDCSRMLTLLSEQIKDPNLAYRLNPKTISDLTDVVYQMARMAELYSVVVVYIHSQKVAMEETAKKLISVVR